MVVGDENYGEGSSREHAALEPSSSEVPQSSPNPSPGSRLIFLAREDEDFLGLSNFFVHKENSILLLLRT